MKLRLALVLGGLLFAGACFWLLTIPSEPPPASHPQGPSISKPVVKALPPGPEIATEPVPSAPAPAAPPAVPSVRASSPATQVAPPGAPLAAATPPARADLVAELDNVRLMLRDYRTLMGDNPVGSNAEIMKAIMGGNPKHARLGPPEGQSVNGEGELVDRWGTPYFFHQLSATHMEIRSAGPDKIMWTSDDIVVH